MGAAVFLELNKPADASDIIQTRNLDCAKLEIVRLRQNLGHLADQYGMTVLSLDASDLVHGINEAEDFTRCIEEIKHIRSCLRLNTQASKRRTPAPLPKEFDPTKVYNPAFIAANYPDGVNNNVDDDSDNSDSDVSIGEDKNPDHIIEGKFGRK